MLESLSDYLSLFVLVLFIFIGFYQIFSMSDKNHRKKAQEREEKYYSFLTDLSEDDANTDDDYDI